MPCTPGCRPMPARVAARAGSGRRRCSSSAIPKQSIYRFRRAEPRVFEAARAVRRRRRWAAALLACDHTRRNAPAGAGGAQCGVRAGRRRPASSMAFAPHTTEVGATRAGLGACLPHVPARTARAAERRPRRASRADAPSAGATASPAAPRARRGAARTRGRAGGRRDPSLVVAATGDARRGAWCCAASANPLRLRGAGACAQRHLPHAAAETRLLAESPEALDLIALLDVLASPSHRLSLARALRSPLFGASDDDLLGLAQRAAESGDWWPALLAPPPDRRGRRWTRARRLLPGWHAAARRCRRTTCSTASCAEGELRERLAAARAGGAAAGGARQRSMRCWRRRCELDGGRYATPYAFVRALKRRHAIRSAPPSQPDAVQLLTVHGAKGLEARGGVRRWTPTPSRRNADNATLLVDWPVESRAPAALRLRLLRDPLPAFAARRCWPRAGGAPSARSSMACTWP